jgi:hypothetical protein
LAAARLAAARSIMIRGYLDDRQVECVFFMWEC